MDGKTISAVDKDSLDNHIKSYAYARRKKTDSSEAASSERTNSFEAIISSENVANDLISPSEAVRVYRVAESNSGKLKSNYFYRNRIRGLI